MGAGSGCVGGGGGGRGGVVVAISQHGAQRGEQKELELWSE